MTCLSWKKLKERWPNTLNSQSLTHHMIRILEMSLDFTLSSLVNPLAAQSCDRKPSIHQRRAPE